MFGAWCSARGARCVTFVRELAYMSASARGVRVVPCYSFMWYLPSNKNGWQNVGTLIRIRFCNIHDFCAAFFKLRSSNIRCCDLAPAGCFFAPAVCADVLATALGFHMVLPWPDILPIWPRQVCSACSPAGFTGRSPLGMRPCLK